MTYSGLVLHGYGFRFDTLYRHNDRWNYISPGAFDESLKSAHVVRMLLEHNDDLEFGNSQSNLILHADEYGVAFRCHLRKDKISEHVTALAQSKAFLDCSIGFTYAASNTTTHTVSQNPVHFISKGELQEISFLRAGACPETNATLEDADKCGPLFSDCKASRLVSDNKFNHLIRTLRDIE
ncbi:HK97 family phage prohead protease [Bradyrhizobium erythrophlei]|uniref:Phage prohead protease, HK97 family n=1 Tax=Bradyrhizobium erythrophlei TaxID=1437360 RepID=A0A1M7TLQ6_9BRAD|nr:phage prohead protease, HK97 family [Bradyrhizobium erythrophlei]